MPFLEEDGTLSRRVLTASCSGSPILLLSPPNPQVPLSKHQPLQEPVPGTPGGARHRQRQALHMAVVTRWSRTNRLTQLTRGLPY